MEAAADCNRTFNLLKGVVLSVVTGLIYKPLSPILHAKIR